MWSAISEVVWPVDPTPHDLVFRAHWPGGSTLSDSKVQALMSKQQATGHLVTGLRRWKMRHSGRSILELSDREKWACPRGCGQMYRVSSTRSIKQHIVSCVPRSSLEPAEDSGCCTDNIVNSSLVVNSEGKQEEELRLQQSKSRLEQPVVLRRVPAQFDGFQEDNELAQDMDGSDNALLRGSSSISLCPSPTLPASNFDSTLDWENTPIRRLLRRQQLELEQLSAQHFMQVVTLQDESATAFRDSALRPGGQAS
jgi:hypothetical protein